MKSKVGRLTVKNRCPYSDILIMGKSHYFHDAIDAITAGISRCSSASSPSYFENTFTTSCFFPSCSLFIAYRYCPACFCGAHFLLPGILLLLLLEKFLLPGVVGDRKEVKTLNQDANGNKLMQKEAKILTTTVQASQPLDHHHHRSAGHEAVHLLTAGLISSLNIIFYPSVQVRTSCIGRRLVNYTERVTYYCSIFFLEQYANSFF